MDQDAPLSKCPHGIYLTPYDACSNCYPTPELQAAAKAYARAVVLATVGKPLAQLSDEELPEVRDRLLRLTGLTPGA